MRITLTLDEGIAENLQQAMRASGRSFNEVLNEALRIGLQVHSVPRRDRHFVVEAQDMGLREGRSLGKIADLLEEVEGPAHL